MRRVIVALSLGSALLLASRLPGREILREGSAQMEAGDLAGARARWCDAGEGASATLDYNLGLAWYREGDTPRALGHWRAAAAAAPRDARVAHNLALARAREEGLPEPVGPSVGWLALLTPGEVGAAGIALLALFSAVTWRWRRGQARAQTVAWLGIAGAALSGIGLHAALHQAAHPVAVVVDRPAPLRERPEAASPPGAALAAGAEVRVEAVRGEWVQIASPAGAGWVYATALWWPSEGARAAECVIREAHAEVPHAKRPIPDPPPSGVQPLDQAPR